MRMRVALMSLVLFAWPAQAELLVWKTEAALPVSQQLPGCDPDQDDNCGDSISYINRSTYGVNEYRTYYEGVRVQIGFGTKPNDATMMLADQIHPGAYDWGGTVSGGVFKPRVVIKRFYELTQDGSVPADRNKTKLLAFRLKADGTSCVMPMEDDLTDNVTARSQAQRMLDGPEC